MLSSFLETFLGFISTDGNNYLLSIVIRYICFLRVVQGNRIFKLMIRRGARKIADYIERRKVQTQDNLSLVVADSDHSQYNDKRVTRKSKAVK